MREDVAGAVGAAAGMFSVAATTPIDTDRQPESAIAPIAATTAAPPDMSCFMSSIPSAGLMRDPAGVEGDGLADEAEDEAVRGSLRLVAHDDHLRGVLGTLRDCAEGPHPELARLLQPEGFDGESADLGGDLLCDLGQPLGRELVGRHVREVACAIRPGRDSLRAVRLRGQIRVGDEDEPLDLAPLRLLGLPLPRVVRAEDHAVNDRTSLLGQVDR